MIVCLCNALTDRKLNETIAACDTQRAADVYAACGGRAQCGECVKTIQELINLQKSLQIAAA